ncbi:MAG: Serine/threonine-protein kinase pkn3 [Myxococcaceae bacterium]|nr:Serine/threonine-protein kinase pkn3 [Myxococcaceae bacterium]
MTAKNQPIIEALIGQRIGGRYIVERILGMGGMGIVAAGRYPELGQEVAIKFLRPELAANAVLSARFLREARLAGRVKSPHFVRVFDLGKIESSGIPFLVMELLSGHDLGSELDARGPLPIEDAVDFVLQALVGIAEIHALGIIHRDLKPSNLFVSEAAGTRSVKVLDFGISKESGPVSSALTATDNMIGTPQYMSPEQVKESRTVDESSDVWSLGVILYELLTHALPFVAEGGAVGELFGLILFTDPAPPTKHRADLPAALEAVILKCLRRDRAERYTNVLELAEALRPFASAEGAHRIQAVKQAFATTDPDRLAERAARAASADADDPKTAADIGATLQVTTPEAKRQREDITAPAASATATPPTSTPATKISGPAVNESIATSMTSSKASIVYPRSATPPRRAMPFAIGVIATLGLGGALLFAKLRANSAPPVAATGIVAPTVAIVESAVTVSTVSTVSAPPQGASNLPPPIVALPSAVPSSLAAASTAARLVPSAHAAPRPPVLRPVPHAGPSAQPDLLLDRK